MKRRNFLKKLPLVAGIPFAIGGIPLKALGANPLSRLARLSNNGRVLIILQLHGGNDGLNMLIPVEQYDTYYSRRANIAIPAKNSLRKYIPLDSTLPADAQIGLHPDMLAIKGLYDSGKVAFVQGVSYKNNNGSHFRGRDIWFMGGGADDYYPSGWVGRYLQKEFEELGQYPEDFPNPEMLDPLGIEMGSDVSLIFHQQGNIPTSISVDNVGQFANLVNTLQGFNDTEIDPRGRPPAIVENSPYWKEMNWILGLEQKSDDYAQRLFDVWTAGGGGTATGGTSVNYPEVYPFNAPNGSKRNNLSGQLKLIAQLLAGGCQTKVFMVKIGGFDTHAEQTTSYDPTMGAHAALLYHISAAMKAFQDDLRSRSIEDRVLTVTTSEFGRRVHSNGSYGTDHGTGAPIMIFGRGANPGVVGVVPDMNQNNIEMQYDYRQVYANLLKDWMEVDEAVINNDIFFGNFIDGPREEGGNYEPLPLAVNVITGSEDFVSQRYALDQCYPNPAKTVTNIRFKVNHEAPVVIDLFDSRGDRIRNLINANYAPGTHTVQVQISDLKSGMYIYQMKTGVFKDSKKMIITK
jgi:uncharacterized protein (DUF1501 family)